MTNPTDYQELLARIHDKAANGLAAVKLPLPAEIHKQGLFGIMEDIWSITKDAWESEVGERSEKP